MSKLKVVIAEDDVTMVNLLRTLLKMEGFEVFALHADEDIVKAVNANCPDVLVMDVHLLNQNGLDILDTMRKSEQSCGARIIMISGFDLREDCMKHGADGFLLKPFMPDDLIQLIKG
jgi:DNA-binding response OmpR family regulator